MKRIIWILLMTLVSCVCTCYGSSTFAGPWSQKSNGATPRTDPSAVAYNGKIYLLAGKGSDNGSLCDFWEYNITNDSWTQKVGNFITRSDHTAILYNDKMYVFAGSQREPGSVNSRVLYNDVWEYDMTNETWTQKNSGAIARDHHTAVVYGGNMYVFGGEWCSPPPNRFNDLWVYNIEADTWSQRSDGPYLSHHSAVIYDGKMYIFGGVDESEIAVSDLWEYDIATDVWIQKANAPFSSAEHSAVVFNDKMYVFGGALGPTSPLNFSFWEYEFSTGCWTNKPPVGTCPAPRFGNTAVIANDKMYIFGGGQGQSAILDDLWEYDFSYPVLGHSAGFANFYGGSSYDSPDGRADHIICQTSDEGYITVGTTESFGQGGKDIWVIKLLSNGEIEWQKSYGGSLDDEARSIQQTPDGGYLAIGSTSSYGVGCGGTCADIWILKLNSSGGIQWQKAYGWSGGYTGSPFSFQQSEDGGYVVLGMTNQFDEEHCDFVVLKLNSLGEMTWAKTYGGDNGEEARSIQQTKDGGYIVAGATTSFVTHESEKNCSHGSNGNAWILKISSTGVVEWQKAYGGSGCDIAHTIRETSDGGYIVAGDTDLDGTTEDTNAWVFKLTSSGNVVWSKTYGDFDVATFSIEQTSDGGYIVGGSLIMKLDPSGQIEWQKLYGGSRQNYTMSVKTIEGGYVVLGYNELFGAGNGDFWIFTLDTNGNKACCNLGCSAQNMGVIPGPVSSLISTAEINAPEFTVTNTSAVGKVSSAAINTQCPNSSVDSVDNVVIQNTALVSNAICECSGASSITIGTGGTIKSGANFTFKSPSVKIQSGFHAENGSVVNIKQQ